MAIDTNKTPILKYPFPQGTFLKATRGQSNTEFIVPSNGVFPPDSGGYLRNDGSGNLIWAPVPAAGGLFAQTSTSPFVTGVVEQTLIGTGVGTLQVPANGFIVGDSFTAKLGGNLNCANNETLHIRIYGDGALLADTGNIQMPAVTNKNWEMEITFTVRSIGGPGVAVIASHGTFIYEKNASLAFEGVTFSVINNTTFNTTILNTLNVTAQWGSVNVANQIDTEVFVLNKIF